MVYIAPDGTVHQNAPWSLQRLIGLFWGLITFIVYFFQTLVGLEPSPSNRNRFGSSRGSGGNGPGGGGPGKGPKRIGGVTTIQDCSMPGGG